MKVVSLSLVLVFLTFLASVSFAASSEANETYEIRLKGGGLGLVVDAVLNGRLKTQFLVDTGASFVTISRSTAEELGIQIDDDTAEAAVMTASGWEVVPMTVLRKIVIGGAEVSNVEALIMDLPQRSEIDGLLGLTFLNKFKVSVDSNRGRLILVSLKGKPSRERPGGYDRNYWTQQFQFYRNVIRQIEQSKTTMLQQLKESSDRDSRKTRRYERQSERLDKLIRYFKDQLSRLDRQAARAGVPMHWRR